MMTTDNDGNISEDQENHVDQKPGDDNGKTQVQIDKEDRDQLVKAEVSAPISESQVEQGRELVDGNGRRDTPEVEPVRPDIIVDEDADTQAKQDRAQREHAQQVQDKQKAKLNQNSKPGVAPSDSKH